MKGAPQGRSQEMQRTMIDAEEIAAEVERYPLTGRFLMGRLRHAIREQERALLESLVTETAYVEAGTTVLRRGELVSRSTILIDGYMMRTGTDGSRRFILGLQVPGDFVDLHGFALRRLDHDLVSAGPVKVGYVPHDRLTEVVANEPHLARILWFATLLDAAIHREWIMKLEQLTAARRVAHVFAELWYRLDQVGLGRTDSVRTPLIQADLADMCGTTAIHMNRALAQLRKEGIGELRRGTLYVQDRQQLEEFATFDPSYLYGRGQLAIEGSLEQPGGK
ncbi:Crp/Fnr family transcriptional regulator [Croceibacterium sp. TMG7-5b_MA50]|uniref:Crp/Fnr family transcriptional regulator n=1 Tax=Croceibacterium sp. TMG7-5b_MA50 TaxID=3121290 RepID=UPI003221554C